MFQSAVSPATQATFTSYSELKLPPALAKSLDAMGFTKPTPIQSQAIPVALENQDVLGCAQTGTGKTAAFLIPIVTRLLRTPNRQALILTPTREIAAQIAQVAEQMTAKSPELKIALLIGGVGMKPQVKTLARRPQLLIATPGRMVDHLNRGSTSLMSVDVFVLDEADRMLDMGFAPQLNEIIRRLPPKRQTLLFSATMPNEIKKLAMKLLRDPVQVTIGQVSKPVERIEQEVIATTAKDKNGLLLDQINARQGSILIFARTQVRTDRVAKYLNSYGLDVGRIHGGRTQGQRTQALDGFRTGKLRILVATDIAARGIDVSHIAHVINFDLPQVAEDYVHRIGRTARAGAEGKAVSFVTPEEKDLWRAIEKITQKKNAGAITIQAPKPSTPSQPQASLGAVPTTRAMDEKPAVSSGRPDQRSDRDHAARSPRPPKKQHRKGARPSHHAGTRPSAQPSTAAPRPSLTPAKLIQPRTIDSEIS